MAHPLSFEEQIKLESLDEIDERIWLEMQLLEYTPACEDRKHLVLRSDPGPITHPINPKTDPIEEKLTDEELERLMVPPITMADIFRARGLKEPSPPGEHGMYCHTCTAPVI